MGIGQSLGRVMLFLGCAVALAACASGGGGSGGGISTITTAAPALPATAPAPALPATAPIGVTLDGSGSFPTAASFRVLYAVQSTSAAAPVSGQDGAAIFSTSGSTTSVQLVIPSANINTTLISDYNHA